MSLRKAIGIGPVLALSFVAIVILVVIAWTGVSQSTTFAAEDQAPAANPPNANGHRPQTLPLDERIRDSLRYELIELEMVDYPLKEALNIVKGQLGFEIVIDTRALAETNVNDDAPITLSVRNSKIGSALHLILTPLKLDWIVEDGVVKVTSLSVSQTTFWTEVYFVEDLDSLGNSQEIGDLILRCVATRSWNTESGGAIRTLKGLLIVYQTERQHAEIAQFLEKLRRLKSLIVKTDVNELSK